MQRIPVSFFPVPPSFSSGEENSLANQSLLERIFLRLLNEKKIYCEKNSWFLDIKEFVSPILEKIRTKQFVFIPESRRSDYEYFFKQQRRLRISGDFRTDYKLPDFACIESETVEKVSSEFAPWFIDAVLIIDAIKKRFQEIPYLALLAFEGTEMKTIEGILILGYLLCGDPLFKEITLYRKGFRHTKPATPAGTEDVRFGVAACPGKYRCDPLASSEVRRRFMLFANKIWNAARFIATYTKREDEVTLSFGAGNEIDLWFAHLLTNTVDQVNDLMEQHRVNEAFLHLQKVFRKDFCNRYLDTVRIKLGQIQTRAMMRYSMLEFLKLFYPFLPFISQKLYNLLTQTSASIETFNYPTFNSDMIFPNHYTSVELLDQLIRAAIKTRDESGILMSEDFRVALYSRSQKERETIKRLVPFFNHRTGSSETIVSDQLSKETSGLQGEYLNWQILIQLEDDSRRSQLLNRLQTEIKNAEDKIVDLEEQLHSKKPGVANNDSRTRKTKHTLQELFRRKEILKKRLHDLS